MTPREIAVSSDGPGAYVSKGSLCSCFDTWFSDPSTSCIGRWYFLWEDFRGKTIGVGLDKSAAGGPPPAPCHTMVSAQLGVLGRFGGNEGHDAHILYTLSALQVMALLGELDRVDKEKVTQTA